jgi:hypothetical protein
VNQSTPNSLDNHFWIMTPLGATWGHRADDRRFWHVTHRNVHIIWGGIMDDYGNLVHSPVYWQPYSERTAEYH